MSIKRVRIIDSNGNPKMVMPHIASNAKLLKDYGFTVEQPKQDVDNDVKKEEETESVPVKKSKKEKI